MDTQEAVKFFEDLRKFSVEVLKYIKAPTGPGAKVRKWKFGRPKGIIEHFTAGVSWKSSAAWLNNPTNQHSSCHFLITDTLVTEVEAIRAKYPSIHFLPVTCLLLSDIKQGTWHAGWANSMCVGIENRNAGEIRKKGDKYYWWARNWTDEFPAVLGKTPVFVNGKYWEPYTKGQIKANIHIGRALQAMTSAEGGLSRNWIIPHSCVSGQKADTGPAFPLFDVRDAVFSGNPVDQMDFISKMADDPVYIRDYDEVNDSAFLSELAARQSDRNVDEELTDKDFKNMISVPTADLQLLIKQGDWKKELDAVRRALSKLEYHVTGAGPTLDTDTSTAVQFFQRSMGLKADGVPGDITQRAIHERLSSLGLL